MHVWWLFLTKEYLIGDDEKLSFISKIGSTRKTQKKSIHLLGKLKFVFFSVFISIFIWGFFMFLLICSNQMNDFSCGWLFVYEMFEWKC